MQNAPGLSIIGPGVPMSVSRAEKRHPRTPVQKLLTTREDIIAFADFIAQDERWLRIVAGSLAVIAANDEKIRVDALPRWKKILRRLALVK